MSSVEDLVPTADNSSGTEGNSLVEKQGNEVDQIAQDHGNSDVESWTILEKEESDTDIKKDVGTGQTECKDNLSLCSSRDGGLQDVGQIDDDIVETSVNRDSDSESIETISDTSDGERIEQGDFLLNNPSDSSVLSDGIRIADWYQGDHADQPQDDNWNEGYEARVREETANLGEREQENGDNWREDDNRIEEYEVRERDEAANRGERQQENRVEEVAANELPEANLNEEHELRFGQPGYDLDDDGLPGAPLDPVNDNAELYPSQELDDNFQVIERGEVYRHDRNRSLNIFLSAMLVVVLAMVVGLGVGHFIGLSERLEVQEMYENIQEEKLETMTDELVTCITGEEGLGGDDQDLDDRVIRQLWDENQELRDQIQHLKSNEDDQGEEAMAAILRDRITDLLTANAQLEKEVARLRINDAARIAAASKETLEALKKTRDNLNNVVTENDQLKIEVAKARYAYPPVAQSSPKSSNADKVLVNELVNENEDLKTEIRKMRYQAPAVQDVLKKDAIDDTHNEEKQVENEDDDEAKEKKEEDDDGVEDTDAIDDAHNEEKQVENEDDDKKEEEDSDEVEDTDIKNTLSEFANFLSVIIGKLGKDVVREGKVNLKEAKRLVDSLKTNIEDKFEDIVKPSMSSLNELIVDKLKDLNTFTKTNKMKEHVAATQKATAKFGKTIVDAVKKLKEAGEEAAKESDWTNILSSEVDNVKIGLEKNWEHIKNKWENIVEKMAKRDNQVKDKYDDEDEDKNNNRLSKYESKMEGEDDLKHFNEKKRGETRERKYNMKNEEKSRSEKKSKTDRHNHINWDSKRREARQKLRRTDEQASWIFERAKHRDQVRNEEKRSDWYFDRQHNQEDFELYNEHKNTRKKEKKNGSKNDWETLDIKDNKFRKSNNKNGKKENRGEWGSHEDKEGQKYDRKENREINPENEYLQNYQERPGKRYKHTKRHRQFRMENF